MKTITLSILDFTTTPGGRFRKFGACSAEEFYEDFVQPSFDKALKNNEILNIDLDGSHGCASSFLDQVFYSLYKEFGMEAIDNHLEITSEECGYDKKVEGFFREYKEEESGIRTVKKGVPSINRGKFFGIFGESNKEK